MTTANEAPDICTSLECNSAGSAACRLEYCCAMKTREEIFEDHRRNKPEYELLRKATKARRWKNNILTVEEFDFAAVLGARLEKELKEEEEEG